MNLIKEIKESRSLVLLFPKSYLSFPKKESFSFEHCHSSGMAFYWCWIGPMACDWKWWALSPRGNCESHCVFIPAFSSFSLSRKKRWVSTGACPLVWVLESVRRYVEKSWQPTIFGCLHKRVKKWDGCKPLRYVFGCYPCKTD